MPSRTALAPARTNPPSRQRTVDHQRRITDAVAQRTTDHQHGVAAAVAQQYQLSQLPTPTRQRTADHQRRITDALAQRDRQRLAYEREEVGRLALGQGPHPGGTPDQRLRNWRRRQQVRTPRATERRQPTARATERRQPTARATERRQPTTTRHQSHSLYTPYGIRVGAAPAVNPGEEALVRLEDSLYTRDGILRGAAPTGVAARREAALIRVRDAPAATAARSTRTDDAIRGGKPRRKRSRKRRKKKGKTLNKCRTCGWRRTRGLRRTRR